MMNSFEGKVVLVTGASSGIGETAAAAFQAAGARVHGLARRREAVDAARARNPKVKWLVADVANPGQVKVAVDRLVDDEGRLDVLVNNAAVFVFAPLEATTEDAMRSQFEINVFGLTFVTQAALPALRASKGSIVNIGSAAGHKPVPGGAHYAATKAAVESLTRSWALELAPQGVRVNAVAPGPTETPGFEKQGLTPDQIAGIKAAFVRQVPLGRMASTEEIATWVLHIADPSNSWMTGEILAIDGGMSLT